MEEQQVMNEIMEQCNITPLEMDFIRLLGCSDFAYEYEDSGICGYVNAQEGFDMKRVRGVMASLVNKEIIEVDNSGNDMGGYNTWVVVTNMYIVTTLGTFWGLI
ncbi:MAG: hypothetical protein CME38_05150 [Haliea sp.]|nr:hypothetical protein [Haliea sp.]